MGSRQRQVPWGQVPWELGVLWCPPNEAGPGGVEKELQARTQRELVSPFLKGSVCSGPLVGTPVQPSCPLLPALVPL